MRTTSILGLIIVTATTHAQFTMQTSNTTADLRGIHNVGNGVAWASGTNGTVLRTEDGGYVWQSCSIPPGAEKLDFRGIQAFDANTAIVMSSGPGSQSRLYKTTDGCHTWKLLFTNPDKDGFWDAIQFTYLHPKYGAGWLLGDPVNGRFTLFDISNGGEKWIRQENAGLAATSDKQGAFAASNSSLIHLEGKIIFASGGNAGARIYRETFALHCIDRCFLCRNGCPKNPKGRRNKWDVQTVPVGGASQGAGVFSLAGKDTSSGKIGENTVVAVGGDYTKPEDTTNIAAFSSDSGERWTASTTQPHGYRSSVAYDPSTKTWITVGPNGTDISTDDGRKWRPVHPDSALHEPPDADRNWNALSLPYVVGPHGRIGKLDEAVIKR